MRALTFVPLLMLAACGRGAQGPAPHQIRLVGASAGLPFTSDIAERFTRANADSIAPLVQAGGNVSGIARFCGGLGREYPDLVVATRPMTAAERADCASHGVHAIAAIPFGWTALVAVTAPGGPALAPSRADLVRAFSGDAARWSDVDSSLPPVAVALHGLASAAGDDPLGAPARRDGRYVSHGADAALVASAVATTPGSVGLLPYAQALAAAAPLRLLSVDGVAPTPVTIADGRYPLALPLILLVKTGEAGAVPGMPALLGLFARAIDPGGPFATLGLVPLAATPRADAARRIAAAARL